MTDNRLKTGDKVRVTYLATVDEVGAERLTVVRSGIGHGRYSTVFPDEVTPVIELEDGALYQDGDGDYWIAQNGQLQLLLATGGPKTSEEVAESTGGFGKVWSE